jgi:hypothetical protein
LKLSSPFLVAAACGVLALPGCGDDSETTGKPAKPATTAPDAQASPNAEAIREIGATRIGLDQALKQLRRGNEKAAEETVSETYLQHFELVEGPLDKVDHELNEDLEHTIREDLRKKVASGADPAEVGKLIDEVKADLDTAEAKLK